MVSKQEIVAEQILKRIHIHDQDKGGTFTLLTGSPGTGKTGVMCSFTDYTTIHHPNDKIFWSECYRAPLQSLKLKSKVQYMVKNDINAHFRNRDDKLSCVDVPIVYFDDYIDLYEKAKRGVVNVPFFGNRLYWMDFIDHLRNVGEWVHVFVDEIGEITPAFEQSLLWKRIGLFGKEVMKDIRKDMIQMCANTQALANVDFRTRNQIMIKIYLPGAKADTRGRVTQRAIDNLQENPVMGNEAYLEMEGKFGKTRFTDIYKPVCGKHWDIVCNGGRGIRYEIPLYIVEELKYYRQLLKADLNGS